MSWLGWLLFESATALAVVLGILLFVLLVRWRRTGRPRALLVGLGVAAALLVMERLVVTRVESAAATLAAIQVDLVRARTDALAAALAPEFRAGDMDGAAFLDYVQNRLRDWRVRWVERIARLEIDDAGTGRFATSASFLAEVVGHFSGTFPSSWRITFTHTPAGWQIERIEPEQIAGQHLTWSEIARR